MRKLSLYLTASLLMVSAGSVKADVIKLTTGKAVGEELTLGLNVKTQAQLVWGNGDTEDFLFNGQPQKVTVKSGTLEIQTGDEYPITRFYAPANAITTLDVTGAPSLLKLFCPSNEISELNLSQNTALTDLDVQGNALTALDLKKNTKLAYLNCAQNQLSTLSYTASGSKLEVFVCSENNLKSVGTVTSLNSLQTLWANQNQLTTISVSSLSKLEKVNASSNALASFIFGSKKSKLTDLWLENNNLKKLDFSKGVPALECLSVDHNQLIEVKWDSAYGEKMKYAYMNDNELYFKHFPRIGTSKVNAIYAPQRPFYFTNDLPIGEEHDFSSFLENFYGTKLSATLKFYNGEGLLLTRKKETGDYYNTNTGIYTFYKQNLGVTISATSRYFRAITLTSQPFNVYDPTGIDDVQTDDNGFSVSASRGSLTIVTSKPCALNVYDTTGRCVVRENISVGDHAYSLPAGIYIVNGQKYLVP